MTRHLTLKDKAEMKYEGRKENCMKQFKITYSLRPDAEDIVIIIFAKTYEDACIFAKEYRREGFSCEEI